MKKKLFIFALVAVLGVFSAAMFTACGEESSAPAQYSYYTFIYDEALDGLILDVTYSGKLPSGELTLPESSYYYKDLATDKEDVLHEKALKVVAVAAGAFEGCHNITGVTFSSGIKQIGEGAFKNCTELVSVGMTSAISVIPADAFNGCSSLKSISGGKLTEIGARAFRNCMKLTSFGFDLSTIEKVGDEAFSYCIGIKSIDVSNADESNVSDTAFTGWREEQEIKR